ncbi:hypothetical protein GF373_00025 [bacterium]|nr:hypothetical protein [bacterium]
MRSLQNSVFSLAPSHYKGVGTVWDSGVEEGMTLELFHERVFWRILGCVILFGFLFLFFSDWIFKRWD